MAKRKRKPPKPKPPPTQLVGRCRRAIGAPYALTVHDLMRNWIHPLDYAVERMIELQPQEDPDGRRREPESPA